MEVIFVNDKFFKAESLEKVIKNSIIKTLKEQKELQEEETEEEDLEGPLGDELVNNIKAGGNKKDQGVTIDEVSNKDNKNIVVKIFSNNKEVFSISGDILKLDEKLINKIQNLQN